MKVSSTSDIGVRAPVQYEVAMKTSANPVQQASWRLLSALITLGLFSLISGCKTPAQPPPPLHELQTGENLKVLEKNNSKSILALICVVEIKDGVVTPRLYNIHIHTCQSSNTKAILHYYTTQVDPSPTMVNLRGERKHYCLLITDFHFSTEINFIVSELSFIRMIIYCTIIFCF